MSEKQHTIDSDNKLPHIPGCLNRHVGDTPREGNGNTCSHRWQAYKKMNDDSGLYNWEKYKSLSEENGKKTIETAKIGFPKWYTSTLKQPKKNEWDVGVSNKDYNDAINFYEKCYIPYWHEAHHIVCNSTLRKAISDFAKAAENDGLIKVIREGLLKEEYNLNDKKNMIMLPMDKAVADAIGLPRHRKTAAHWHHSSYSKNVKNQLEKIFNNLKQELVPHKNPKYKNLKDQIESLSESLYDKIKSSESKALDNMDNTEFDIIQPIP
ncbi:MAG: AHH domain-containing protein [Candidatus Brocadia sp.]|nr:AHH domain-containing protein [Candidatus Brocadia sp.]